MTKEKALELLHSKMQSQNLRKHCYSVGAVMRSLAKHFNEDENRYEIVGLLHDGDYEFTKDDPGNHAKLMANWARENGETDEELLTGIESHGWFHQGKKPETKMQWALFCCDELTGLIIAVTLIRPDRKLATVTVDNILSKWNQKSFAAGVKREDIENCEKELGITLKDFIQIALTAMQGISEELGL
ncbi:MAG: HD domain-containing protein [Candidatus Woesebacteria bacterium]|nr:MAG: HD domain-containing protein [Candidatus Woesebacteria bacterium]